MSEKLDQKALEAAFQAAARVYLSALSHGWRDMAAFPDDDKMKLIALSSGSVTLAPGISREPLPKKARRDMAKMGHWPNHRDFTPIAWMYAPTVSLPEPPHD